MEKLFQKTIPFSNLRSLNLKRNLEQEAMMYSTKTKVSCRKNVITQEEKPTALLSTTDEISDLVSQYTTLRVSSWHHKHSKEFDNRAAMSHSRLIHTKRNLKKFQHQLLLKNCNITYWRQVLMHAFLQLNWPFYPI